MVVAIENIKEYDHNPRRERNEAYDRIKGSIRQRGFTGALPITRRPGEAEYMVAEGGNTVLHILKELCAETHDPRFYSVHCLFEPWKSESEILIAHLVENDARGELIFIDRARAVHELRELLEQEAGAPRSIRQLATLLRERGYSIDHTMIIRLDYAVETLLPVIPMALRAGLGRDEVQQIRKLESILVTFLEDRQRDTAVIEGARRWFLDCLGRHDGEYFSLDPVQQELEAQIAELCGETIAKVRADFGLIEQTGKPGHDAPPPVPFNLPEPRPKSPRAPAGAPPASVPTLDDETSGADVEGRAWPDAWDADADAPGEPAEVRPLAPERPGAIAQSPRETELPQDVKSLRARMWTLAMQLAQRHGLGECVLTCPKGCGFLVDLPEQPPFAGEAPGSAEEAQCVTLWWMLAGLAEEWPHGYGVEMAPALGYLEDARIYPAIKAVAEGDDSTPLSTLVPRVSYPPSLAIVPRDLFAVLDDRDYERLVQLIDTRRGLQAHCRRLGKQRVWEL